MAYEDVPPRLASGEKVSRAEIIGLYGPTTDIPVTLGLSVLSAAGIMERLYEDETVKYRLTSLGMAIRTSLIVYLEGDCPDCE